MMPVSEETCNLVCKGLYGFWNFPQHPAPVEAFTEPYIMCVVQRPCSSKAHLPLNSETNRRCRYVHTHHAGNGWYFQVAEGVAECFVA